VLLAVLTRKVINIIDSKLSSSDKIHRLAYQYNESNKSLRISSEYYTTLDSSKKFIIGYNKQLDFDSLKIEQKYLDQLPLDSDDNITHTSFFSDIYNIINTSSTADYCSRIKFLDCTTWGEVKILFSALSSIQGDYYQEFTLSSNEIYNSALLSLIVSNTTKVEYIITIKNHGFIKKEDISYY
jgi:hypothetical protein